MPVFRFPQNLWALCSQSLVSSSASRAVSLLLWSVALSSALSLAQPPVPHIDMLSPAAVAPAQGEDLQLTIKGTGFASNAQINFQGVTLTPASVSNTSLTVTVPAAKLTIATVATVSVANPNTPAKPNKSNPIFFPIGNATPSVAMNPMTLTQTASQPLASVVGDFNGDGKLDIATANYCVTPAACANTTAFTVLLNNGKGSFSALPASPFNSDAAAIATGDFNGDGKLDLVIANNCANRGVCTSTSTGTVTVLLGDGTGNFAASSSPSVSYNPTSIVVDDFNGDGNLDLGVMNDAGALIVLLGDGAGRFLTSYASQVTGTSMVAGDFNEDGKLDIIAGSTLLLGDGTGNFTSHLNTGAQAGAVGDFNGDRHLDLAVTAYPCSQYCPSGTINILVGDGSGHFTPAGTVGSGGLYPGQVAVGDLNGDGHLDLVVANQQQPNMSVSSGTVTILLGDGTAKFTPTSSASVLHGARSVALADFDANGKLDAVAATSNYSVVTLLQPSAPEIGIPKALSFGNLNMGSAATVALTITNASNLTPLNIQAVAVQAGPNTTSSDFAAQLNDCAAVLPAGASCSLSVTFTPAAIGTETATLTVTDNSGTGSQTVSLTGTSVSQYDSAISVTFASTQLAYPGATNVIVAVAGAQNKIATGTITLLDGAAPLTTLTLGGDGKAYWYISPALASGMHQISAVYSGDHNNPGGKSAPLSVTVSAASVNLSASCWNASFPFGQNYSCVVTVSSNAGPAVGSLTYSLDSISPVSVPLSNGNAQFTIAQPAAGNHTVSIQYSAQGNFAASSVNTQKFVVTPVAPVQNQSGSSASAQPVISDPKPQVAATPLLTQSSITYGTAMAVHMACSTSGSTIFYTTNGAIPNHNSTAFTTDLAVPTSETINAICIAPNFTDSAAASLQLTIAASPTYSLTAGTYNSPQQLAVSCAAPAAAIYYTTNGSTPTTSSSLYSAGTPLTVSSSEMVTSICSVPGNLNSTPASVVLIIKNPQAAMQSMALVVDRTSPGAPIPSDFLGLSFDATYMNQPWFNTKDTTLTNLLTNLGGGTLRFGASNIDFTYWSRDTSTTFPQAKLTLHPADVDNLFAFSKNVGWKVIFGLNLLANDPAMDADEASYVSQAAGSNLLAFEIGNEPDGYVGQNEKTTYAYTDFKTDFDKFSQAIWAKAPNAPIAGPVTSGGWLSNFLKDESTKIPMVSQHYYAGPVVTPSILSTSMTASTNSVLQNYYSTTLPYKLPIRMTEMNSEWSGVVNGDIANTFVDALWMTDYLLSTAKQGYAGVNLHGGVGQCRYYSPLCSSNGTATPQAVYYSMLLFHAATTQSRMVPISAPSNNNVTAYAMLANNGTLKVVLINKDFSTPASVQLSPGKAYAQATAQRLESGSLLATSGVTFAGSAVNSDGTWSGRTTESLPISNGTALVQVPAGSAVVISFQ